LRAPSFLFNDLAFLCLPRKSLKFLMLLFSPARMELDGQFECFRPGMVFLRKVLDEVVVGSALLIAARCAYSSALKQKFFRGDRL